MFDTVLLKIKEKERERKRELKKSNRETSQIPKSERAEITHSHSRLCRHHEGYPVHEGFVLSGLRFKNSDIQFYTYIVCF